MIVMIWYDIRGNYVGTFYCRDDAKCIANFYYSLAGCPKYIETNYIVWSVWNSMFFIYYDI